MTDILHIAIDSVKYTIGIAIGVGSVAVAGFFLSAIIMGIIEAMKQGIK